MNCRGRYNYFSDSVKYRSWTTSSIGVLCHDRANPQLRTRVSRKLAGSVPSRLVGSDPDCFPLTDPGTDCPKIPLLPRSQVTDSVCPEFPILDAHKELFWGSGGPRERARRPSACIKPNPLMLLKKRSRQRCYSSRYERLCRTLLMQSGAAAGQFPWRNGSHSQLAGSDHPLHTLHRCTAEVELDVHVFCSVLQLQLSIDPLFVEFAVRTSQTTTACTPKGFHGIAASNISTQMK